MIRYRARVIFRIKGALSMTAMEVRHLVKSVSGVTRGCWQER